MKIDRHTNALLRKRTRLAKELDSVCHELDRFLSKNGIDPDSACWLGGVEIYVNPEAAEEEVRTAINSFMPVQLDGGAKI